MHIQCQIRKIAVPATKEEQIRQKFLRYLIHTLGFPPSLIAVEKELARIPHLANAPHPLPPRRIDILCFEKNEIRDCPLSPLLLVECKAIKINKKAFQQAIGYHHLVKSRFLTLVSEEKILTGWYNPQIKNYEFISFLPTYEELMDSTLNKLRS